MPTACFKAASAFGRHERVLQENAHEDVIAPPTKQESRQERGRHECVQETTKFGQTPCLPNMLQIPRNIADNPKCSTDAGSKMLRARCKQGIQGQNALNTMQIA